ncbi:hypothetical protein H4R33_001582 [Dimargaris cristalligena]|nr:hypothetical protein H4R33_001582 [Dimargaris cristalligena]
MTPEEIVQRLKQSGAFDELRERLLAEFLNDELCQEYKQEIASTMKDLAGQCSQHQLKNKQYFPSRIRERLASQKTTQRIINEVSDNILNSQAYQDTLNTHIERSIEYLNTHKDEPDPKANPPSALSTPNEMAPTPESARLNKSELRDPSQILQSLLQVTPLERSDQTPPIRVGQVVAAFIPPTLSTTASPPDLKTDCCLLVIVIAQEEEEPRFRVRNLEAPMPEGDDVATNFSPGERLNARETWRIHSQRAVGLTIREPFAVRDIVFSVQRVPGETKFTSELFRAKVAKVSNKFVRVKFLGGDLCTVPVGRLFKISRLRGISASKQTDSLEEKSRVEPKATGVASKFSCPSPAGLSSPKDTIPPHESLIIEANSGLVEATDLDTRYESAAATNLAQTASNHPIEPTGDSPGGPLIDVNAPDLNDNIVPREADIFDSDSDASTLSSLASDMFSDHD